MIIPKSVEYEIEGHFLCYREEKQQIEDIETEIAEAITPRLDGVGGSGGVSDPTAQKAAQIEKETRNIRSWVNIVDSTIKHFEREEPYKAELFTMYYERLQSAQTIQILMCISQPTFYRWRKDLITYAALQAVKAGLIEL